MLPSLRALLATLVGSASCGSHASDPPGQDLDSRAVDTTPSTIAQAADTASSSQERSSRFVGIATAPVASVSKLAALPNGDSLTIPVEYELLERQGLDSRIGELPDAAGTVLCSYDIGPFGANVTAAKGTREQSANQVFYYWQRPALQRGRSSPVAGDVRRARSSELLLRGHALTRGVPQLDA